MLELTFKMKKETRKVMCYRCFTVVQGEVFFMECKGALAHFIAPTIDKHFICDECKKKKEDK